MRIIQHTDGLEVIGIVGRVAGNDSATLPEAARAVVEARFDPGGNGGQVGRVRCRIGCAHDQNIAKRQIQHTARRDV